MKKIIIFVFLLAVNYWQPSNAMKPEITENKDQVWQQFFVPDKNYICVCKIRATSLLYAAENDCAFCCLEWIKAGSNINFCNGYASPLYLAAYYAYSTTIQVLLMRGSDMTKEVLSCKTSPIKIASLPLPQGDLEDKRKKFAIKIFLSWPLFVARLSDREKRLAFFCKFDPTSVGPILFRLLIMKRWCKKLPKPLKFKIIESFLKERFHFLYENELVQRIWSSDEPWKEAQACVLEIAKIVKEYGFLDDEVDNFLKCL